MKTSRRVEDIDPAFDPWEQSRPIPLFVLAIFIALAIWGALSYLDDLAPVRRGDTGGLAASAPAQAPADANAPLLVSRGNASLWSCASCHGARGEGAAQTPRLAGLPAEYLPSSCATSPPAPAPTNPCAISRAN